MLLLQPFKQATIAEDSWSVHMEKLILVLAQVVQQLPQCESSDPMVVFSKKILASK
jgi:hypothetical protein